MVELKRLIRDVPDFPRHGILFRDISPLLREHFDTTIQVLDRLLTEAEWSEIDAVAGIESRGFILGAALATRRRKGFVLVRKQGKLPPPVVDVAYDLEYGTDTIEIQEDAISPGQRVVVLDDLLATGGTMQAAIDLVRRRGGEVAAAACIIELSFLNGRSRIDVPFTSMVAYES